jgi:aspartate oxidase|tara:strand:+ start:260 stop:511 length:252 start_codon:yes stop_codon:yes gene_type:complete
VIDKPYVPHDMRYHAEIQYEGEIAMRYVCAAGETLDELAQDITNELRKARHRLPQIVHVEDLETGELITKDFIHDYNKGVYNG